MLGSWIVHTAAAFFCLPPHRRVVLLVVLALALALEAYQGLAAPPPAGWGDPFAGHGAARLVVYDVMFSLFGAVAALAIVPTKKR